MEMLSKGIVGIFFVAALFNKGPVQEKPEVEKADKLHIAGNTLDGFHINTFSNGDKYMVSLFFPSRLTIQASSQSSVSAYFAFLPAT